MHGGTTMVRYGIRTLLAAMCGVAFFFALMTTTPAWFGVPVLWFFTLLLPPSLAALAYYGHGYARAFAVGGFTTAAPMVFAITQTHGIGSGLFEAVFTNRLTEEPVAWLKTVFAITWVMTATSGIATMGVRRLTARSAEAKPAVSAAQVASASNARTQTSVPRPHRESPRP
jgi:hypothetical protein